LKHGDVPSRVVLDFSGVKDRDQHSKTAVPKKAKEPVA